MNERVMVPEVNISGVAPVVYGESAAERLEESKRKFLAGETAYNRVKPGKNRGAPASGTDPAPSNAEIFRRHSEHIKGRGPRGLVQVHGNCKVVGG